MIMPPYVYETLLSHDGNNRGEVRTWRTRVRGRRSLRVLFCPIALVVDFGDFGEGVVAKVESNLDTLIGC